ncbi:hypothetical protein DMC47_29370 [Nostoc sp. 3335mG]|nr:hypothetical protein DMC47_29370 [Nostoc sp. 3335mG]
MTVRSERPLCEEVHVNLAYRWFCRPGPEVEKLVGGEGFAVCSGSYRDNSRRLIATTVTSVPSIARAACHSEVPDQRLCKLYLVDE